MIGGTPISGTPHITFWILDDAGTCKPQDNLNFDRPWPGKQERLNVWMSENARASFSIASSHLSYSGISVVHTDKNRYSTGAARVAKISHPALEIAVLSYFHLYSPVASYHLRAHACPYYIFYWCLTSLLHLLLRLVVVGRRAAIISASSTRSTASW